MLLATSSFSDSKESLGCSGSYIPRHAAVPSTAHYVGTSRENQAFNFMVQPDFFHSTYLQIADVRVSCHHKQLCMRPNSVSVEELHRASSGQATESPIETPCSSASGCRPTPHPTGPTVTTLQLSENQQFMVLTIVNDQPSPRKIACNRQPPSWHTIIDR